MSTPRAAGAVFVLLAASLASAGTEQKPAPRAQQATAAPAQAAPAATTPAPAATTPAPEIKVVTTEPIHALVLPMKGSYTQHPEAFARLAAFFAGHGKAPAGVPFGVYYSDPAVGEANLVWEVGFPVAAGVTAEAPFVIKDIPGALTAVLVYKGPLEELAGGWSSLIQWTFANGYVPSGFAMQLFQGDPVASPQLELRIPVQKTK
jgi:effector-binding domain-containing protein